MIKRILYISSSIGLGHVSRDLAIVRALREKNPEIEIMWLAANPAGNVIKDAGELLLPESDQLGQDSSVAEKTSKGYQLNIAEYSFKALQEWKKSVNVVKDVTSRIRFDLIIADEAYELLMTFLLQPRIKKAPLVMIYDFFGIDATTHHPFEKLGAYLWNAVWVLSNRASWVEDLSLFVGDINDLTDNSLGLFLPNRKDHAFKHFKFIGNILPFKPKDFLDSSEAKQRLGYGPEPLVLCAVGGTSIGIELLNLCSRANRLIKNVIPNLRMILVSGPRIDPGAVQLTDGVEVRGYIPRLYEHFAACDLAIVQGGGNTTLELTALNKNFLYFPLEGHSEQKSVSDKLTRLGAGIKMNYAETSERLLAEVVLENIGKAASYPKIPVDGAIKAVEFIQPLL